MSYVYRFKHYLTSEVIYVGRTTRALKSRMNEHFGNNSHLPNKCYKSVGRIEYIEMKTDSDAYLMEQYMINKYKPIYNKVGKAYDEQTIKLKTIYNRWNLYEDRRKSIIRFNLFGFNPFKNSKYKSNTKKKSKCKDKDNTSDMLILIIIIFFLLAALGGNA